MYFREFDRSGPFGKLIAMHVFNLYGNAMSSITSTQRTKHPGFPKDDSDPYLFNEFKFTKNQQRNELHLYYKYSCI